MSQPSSLPRWADVSGAALNTSYVVDPPAAQKDNGWTKKQRPPSQFMNWWMWIVYLWCVYLKNLKDEVFSWTAAHTFGAASIFNGTATFNSTVTFSGVPKHGTTTLQIPGSSGTSSASAGWTTPDFATSGGASYVVSGASTGSRLIPIPLKQGDRLQVARVRVKMDTSNHGAGDVLVYLVREDSTSGGVTLTGTVGNTDAAGYQTITLTPTPTALATLQHHHIEVIAAHANHEIHLVEVDYDRP